MNAAESSSIRVAQTIANQMAVELLLERSYAEMELSSPDKPNRAANERAIIVCNNLLWALDYLSDQNYLEKPSRCAERQLRPPLKLVVNNK